jgi:hypothetical protein
MHDPSRPVPAPTTRLPSTNSLQIACIRHDQCKPLKCIAAYRNIHNDASGHPYLETGSSREQDSRLGTRDTCRDSEYPGFASSNDRCNGQLKSHQCCLPHRLAICPEPGRSMAESPRDRGCGAVNGKHERCSAFGQTPSAPHPETDGGIARCACPRKTAVRKTVAAKPPGILLRRLRRRLRPCLSSAALRPRTSPHALPPWASLRFAHRLP